MAITTDPTPLADFTAAVVAAGGTLSVYLSPVCAASFDGGPFTFTPDNLSDFTFHEDGDYLIATTEWQGRADREFVVEM